MALLYCSVCFEGRGLKLAKYECRQLGQDCFYECMRTNHILDQENQLPEFPPPTPLKEMHTLQRHIIFVWLVAVVLQLSVHMTKDGGPITADTDGKFFSNFNMILE